MANVVTYGQRKQTLNPIFTKKLESRATPEAFGASIGRGLQNLATGVRQAGDAFAAVKAMEDKAIVDERVNQFSDYTRERTYNPETGYVTLQGGNAVEGRGAFEKDLEDNRKSIGKDLTPAQRRLYDEATNARRRQALDTGIRHAAAQRKQWFDDASTARLNTFADDALAMSDEPEKLALNLAAASKEIDERAAANGWSTEQTKAAQEEFKSGVHKNIVLKNAIDDPLKAKAWLDGHRKEMTQAHQYELDKALAAPVLEATAQHEADRIMRGEGANARPPRANAAGSVDMRVNRTNSSVDFEHVKPDTKTAFGKLQTALGRQLTVRSGYRSPEANKAVGGAKKSRHMHGDAIDIDVRGMSRIERLRLIDAAFNAGFTGIGVGTNTIHVDQGNPRAWGYATSSGGAPVPAYAAPLVEKRLAALRGENGGAVKGRVPSNVSTGGVDAATAMLRSFESYSGNTYWDVNHHRVGYGSDTITDVSGVVRRVKKGDVVTRADAERDLARRVGASNLRLQKEFGADVWLKLTPEARGALLSVEYNYGKLPEAVRDAIFVGDTDGIADAVLGLASDNGGVNKGRREAEAAAIRGGTLPPGVDVAGTDAFVGPQWIADQVAGIADPKLRAATATALQKQFALQDAIERRNNRQSKLDAERFIIQNPGANPTDLPLNIQLALGVDGMNVLWAYNDKVKEHGKVETDEVLFAELQRLQAEDPVAFADDVDLFDYIDKLSTDDRRALQKLQVEAIKDRRTGKQEALTKAKSVATAMAIADDRLTAAGIKKTGKDKDEESAQREARFQRALVDRMREFQEKEKRQPNDYEVSDMVDQLLVPIILKTPGALWGTNEEEAFAFEAPFRADDAKIEINIPYDQIPVDVRLAIREELAKELGREPTEDEVRSDYVEFVLGK